MNEKWSQSTVVYNIIENYALTPLFYTALVFSCYANIDCEKYRFSLQA